METVKHAKEAGKVSIMRAQRRRKDKMEEEDLFRRQIDNEEKNNGTHGTYGIYALCDERKKK